LRSPPHPREGVALAGVGEHGHDGAEAAARRELQRAVHEDARGRSDEQALAASCCHLPDGVGDKDPDDLSNRGRPDRDRTNVNEEHALRNWAQSLGVTPEELKEAVHPVARRLSLGAAEPSMIRSKPFETRGTRQSVSGPIQVIESPNQSTRRRHRGDSHGSDASAAVLEPRAAESPCACRVDRSVVRRTVARSASHRSSKGRADCQRGDSANRVRPGARRRGVSSAKHRSSLREPDLPDAAVCVRDSSQAALLASYAEAAACVERHFRKPFVS
jgi:Protein of unknown function (DUF3606)